MVPPYYTLLEMAKSKSVNKNAAIIVPSGPPSTVEQTADASAVLTHELYQSAVIKLFGETLQVFASEYLFS